MYRSRTYVPALVVYEQCTGQDVFKTRTAVVYEQCTGPGRIQKPVVLKDCKPVYMNNVQVQDVFKTRTAVVYEQCTGQGRIQNPYCCSV